MISLEPAAISVQFFRVSLQIEMHKLLAEKIERDPSLLQIPLDNIDRWLAANHAGAHRLEQWRQILLKAQQSDEGFTYLLDLLRDESEAALHLKSFNPFPGVLTSKERQEIILRCVYSH